MSKVNYTVLAFDDMTNEFVVGFNGERINTPAVIVDGKIVEEDTKKSIEEAIKAVLKKKVSKLSPSGAVEMIGTTGAVELSTEEV